MEKAATGHPSLKQPLGQQQARLGDIPGPGRAAMLIGDHSDLVSLVR
jgi:hypothetical protein